MQSREWTLRAATPADRDALAELICLSTNYWYRANGRPALFSGPTPCHLFFDVYESLDPGCCLVLEEPRTGVLAGSCFYHPRPSHISLGIMNAHPNYFGHGVAARLLAHINQIADAEGKPIRLVSSAMNLDSYSLYTRAGFTPQAIYQDMIVPPERVIAGLNVDVSSVRDATASDLDAILNLEWRVSRIRREKDWRYFITNEQKIWDVLVHRSPSGEIDGVLASVDHGGSHIIGPGVMADDASAISLLAAQLTRHATRSPERSPLLLIPAGRPDLVRQVYGWGGRNIEMHVHQVRGDFTGFEGVVMPTFMPETA